MKNNRLVIALAPRNEPMSTLIAELALRGPVTVLDAGNRFEAYRIAQQVRRKSLNVNNIAQHISVRRAFTCYQTVSLLEETHALPQPYVILDLLATFQDDQVTVPESRRLLKICLREIERVRCTAPVAISLSPMPMQEKAFLVDELCARADDIFMLDDPIKQEEEQLVLF